MIKFFRKIRQKLLSENKLSKYLIYAIGEIILVVIGILIALQINNWNENKQIVRTKTEYCEQFLEEFKFDIIEIENTLGSLQQNIKIYDEYIYGYNTPDLTIKQIDENLKKINFLHSTMEFNSKTIDILVNTGEIKFFSKHLKNMLIKLKNSIVLYQNNSSYNFKLYTEQGNKAIYTNPLSIRSFLANQRPLEKVLNIESKLTDEIAFRHNAYSIKNLAEVADIKNLNTIIDLMNELSELIQFVKNLKKINNESTTMAIIHCVRELKN